MRTFIANKKSFYEITEIIPNLIHYWETNGRKARTEKDAIEALKQQFNCTHVVQAEELNDETVDKILAARRTKA